MVLEIDIFQGRAMGLGKMFPALSSNGRTAEHHYFVQRSKQRKKTLS